MQTFDALFVDDEKEFLKSIKTIFGLEGLNVCCVESGEEALDACKCKKFNMIITDLTLGGISGLELAREVRKILPDLPIVLLTGNTIPSELTAMAREAGITKVFTKPVNLDVLLKTVRRKSKKKEKR